MPFNLHHRWISIEQAERDMEEPAPEWEVTTADEIREHYDVLRQRLNDAHAFDGCVVDFGFKRSLSALAKVSAAAQRFNRKGATP